MSLSSRHGGPAWIRLAIVLVLVAGCSDSGGPDASDGGHPPRDASPADGPRPDTGPPPPSIKVHVIDVGAGSCVLVEMPDPTKPVLLVDCGQDVWKGAGVSGSTASAHARKIIGKRKVALVLTHPHADHYSLVDNVLDRGGPSLELSTVWLGGKLDEYSADGGRVQKRLAAFRAAQPAKVHDALPRTYRTPYPKGDADLTFGAVKAYVLAVNESVGAPQPDTNGKSVVLLVKYGWFMAVLPGDADGEVQKLAAQHAKAGGLPLSQAALLLGAHHGSGTHSSNDQAWANAVKPQIMVYSAGRDTGHSGLKMHNGHPYHTVVSRFEALKSLRGAVKHEIYQGLSASKASKREIHSAHYLSASNGVITISSTGQKGNLRVTCQAHAGTTRDTRCGLK